MQGKGFVKFFFGALLFVSLIQFIYIIPTRIVENKADRFAESQSASLTDATAKRVAYKKARSAYLDSISSEKVFRIPLLKSYTYQDLKAAQLNFGLDLKGGMSVLLQVDLRDFIRALAGSADPTLDKALQKASDKQQDSQSDFITLFADAWEEESGGRQLNTLFKRNESLSTQINAGTSDGEVVRILREKANETVDLTYKLLKERIDKMGVVGPNVSLDASRDLILVELPGVDNPKRARTYLQAAAKLEFWNVYRISDSGIQQAFVAANDKLKKMDSGELSQTKPAVPDTSAAAAADTSKAGIDTMTLAEFESSLQPKDTGAAKSDTGTAAKPDTASVGDASLTQQGPLFDNFNLNTDGSIGLSPMGTADKNKRKLVSEMLSRPGIRELFPRDAMFLWSRSPAQGLDEKATSDLYELYLIKKEPGKETAPLEGDHVTESYASPDPSTGELQITLKMDAEGARIWGGMTQKAATDQNREIAIVLDSQVVSAPRVINPILTGDSQITGSYTVQEAQDVANILQIGKLPARTQIIQESLIGPSLGAENIDTSLKSLGIGFLLVLAFMVLYYGGGGVVSIIVLLFNIIFLIAAVASFGTVLTLPGVAGIVLTIGMAVDANVVIYERIKEELRAGKSISQAVKDGFRHSYPPVIDGHVTILLTAIVLFVFGLGPIKGFATVLIAGIITSLFTAVLVCRLVIEWWLARGNSMSFWTERTKNTLSDLHVDWMGKRKAFYAFSAILTVVGLASIFLRGFDLGLDFKGGYSVNVQFEGQAPSADDLRTALATSFGKAPVVKAVDTENTFSISTDYLVNETGGEASDRVIAKLHEGLGALAGGATLEQFKDPDAAGTHVTSFNKVGATVADDIERSSWKAIVFGLLVIFLYILVRFSRWQYSLGAVVATIHDALVVLSVFSLFHGILPWAMEIDQAFIAAMLTIIGYSVNDTVIVFDRIRENFTLHPEKGKHEIINMSINKTMSRTLYSSLTVLFTVIVLWMFGSGSIKGFAFALVVGVIAGTYSSVFIAAPIMVDLSKGDLRITKNTSGREEKVKKSIRHATVKTEKG